MPARPNIVFFFCDDLGWGDVSCLNPESRIRTPNIDALAASGVSFTDAHAGSAVCTPSRYTLMTGRYCWRTRLKDGVNGGYSPALLTPERPTVASRLRDAGYATACIGKWHIGMDWELKPGTPPETGPQQHFRSDEGKLDGSIDFTKPVRNGPVDVGFDYYFGISASLDMSPYVFIENDRVTEVPTGHSPKGTEELRARPGIAAQGWRHEDVLPELERRALSWIEEQAGGAADPAASQQQPFFLYVPINGPHTPVVPTDEWKGRSGCGIYGDFVMQIDAVVGSIVGKLRELGIREQTAFFFSSDNGPETITAPYRERYGHASAWKFRGMKRDNWEGGHRIPFIASWPERVPAGVENRQFVELADFYATALEMAGAPDAPPPGGAAPGEDGTPTPGGEDSFSMLPLLLGETAPAYRTFAVHHSSEGRWAVRRGRWKLLLHPGSGGNEVDCPENDDPVQLYDMETDRFETTNVYADHPDVVRDLKRLCLHVIDRGRSTPGPDAQNDGGQRARTHWNQLRELLELEVGGE
ncbi:MAG: sulfatase family protein [Spirochaetota bacterium]